MNVEGATQFGRLWGASDVMRSVFDTLEEVAQSEATVLILGETGTGKELAARAIHDHSERSDGPYVVVDCAAVPKDLIESELFGHIRGAFTSAHADREGAFEAAHKGTIFIDEIGELPVDLQSRILRVLERRQVKRVGENVTRKVDVRIVAATNRNLEQQIERGDFRQDLYFRLKVVTVHLPALRERPDDVALLAQKFLEESFSGTDLEPPELRTEALSRLKRYPWPGNVRELRNIIDRGAAMSDRVFRVPDDLERSLELGLSEPAQATLAPVVVEEALPPKEPGAITETLWRGKSYKQARDDVLEDFERGYIKAILAENGGNVSKAARAAGIHRNILHRMMARYKITR